MDILKTYWNFNFLDTSKTDIFDVSNYAILQKNDNFIPNFQSEFQKIELLKLENIQKIELCKIDLLERKNISAQEILIPNLKIYSKTINEIIYTSFCLPEKYLYNEILDKKGIYQIKVTFQNTTLYTDLFAMVGAPVAIYECSNANFEVSTNIFSIGITRTDIDSENFSPSYLKISYWNSLLEMEIDSAEIYFDKNVGDPIEIFTFDVSAITVPFDFFVWSGACTGSLEMSVFLAENGDYLIGENIEFLKTE